MKFPHLNGRDKLLEPLGFTGRQAEWITLVCFHSGLFTRDQVETVLGTSRATAWRFTQELLEVRILDKPIAAAATIDGRCIYRIFGKAIYRALEIPNVRHRRESSVEVTRRRLLSLDFVLDHPDLPWLATEQEKVACFEQLGIDPGLLPKRIYAGRAKGRVRYFHIKMPVAVEPARAVFVYIDPGMGTRTELDSWGAAHRELWDKLRQSGRRVELVAAAWEQRHLDRAERVFASWRGRAGSEDDQDMAILRQALSLADWETVDRYGGFDEAVDTLIEWEKQYPVANGGGMIDDFHLWESRRCLRIGAPPAQDVMH